MKMLPGLPSIDSHAIALKQFAASCSPATTMGVYDRPISSQQWNQAMFAEWSRWR
jgi:hypothetical protein